MHRDTNRFLTSLQPSSGSVPISFPWSRVPPYQQDCPASVSSRPRCNRRNSA